MRLSTLTPPRSRAGLIEDALNGNVGSHGAADATVTGTPLTLKELAGIRKAVLNNLF